jgi:hypothetical protein
MIRASVYLLVFIHNLSVVLPKKFYLYTPLLSGGLSNESGKRNDSTKSMGPEPVAFIGALGDVLADLPAGGSGTTKCLWAQGLRRARLRSQA